MCPLQIFGMYLLFLGEKNPTMSVHCFPSHIIQKYTLTASFASGYILCPNFKWTLSQDWHMIRIYALSPLSSSVKIHSDIVYKL